MLVIIGYVLVCSALMGGYIGGGGHPAAAGADIPGTLFDIQKEVLDRTRTLLNSHQDLHKILI